MQVFGAIKILTTVEVNIPVNYSFRSYQSLSTVGVTFMSTVAFRATKNLVDVKS